MSSGVPSTIFFIRHGARLDQLDPEWHLSSPTPYDPPLTQKGFQQSKQTGLAINQILLPHHLSQPTQTSSSQVSEQTHVDPGVRVIIHTSPFLRCIQTALALSSELTLPHKPLLRVDAWLGEWLTPDYYMDIPPPPPSRQLCQSALGELASRVRNEGNVNVDWSWDSLKCGDGGEYGEEWTSMHDRVSKGLHRMLRYYQMPGSVQNGDTVALKTVVILVTHGAGCNALLGALTKKPVLRDIPISSLSMAILRPITPSNNVSPVKSTGIFPSVEYDVISQASIQHLTNPSTPITSSISIFPGSTSSQVAGKDVTAKPTTTRDFGKDNRVLEYHHIRSRSASSGLSTTFSDPVVQTGYQPQSPTTSTTSTTASNNRHPTLTLRTASSLLQGRRGSGSTGANPGLQRSDSRRTSLWTPTSPSMMSDESNEEAVGDSSELPVGSAAAGIAERKKKVGLWKSWAAGEAVEQQDSNKEGNGKFDTGRGRSHSGA